MHYKESPVILQKIKGAKNVVINCHKSPDPDSVGSALSVYLVLKNLGKKVTIVSPDTISSELMFLPYAEEIKTIKCYDFDFSDYDLFIVLDSASIDVVTGDSDTSLPKIPIINIDHHKSNPGYGDINLIDTEASSVSELLFNLFNDWKVKLNKELVTSLYTGIVGDTGCFMYPDTKAETHKVAAQLMEYGADHVGVIFNLFRQMA